MNKIDPGMHQWERKKSDLFQGREENSNHNSWVSRGCLIGQKRMVKSIYITQAIKAYYLFDLRGKTALY